MKCAKCKIEVKVYHKKDRLFMMCKRCGIGISILSSTEAILVPIIWKKFKRKYRTHLDKRQPKRYGNGIV